MIRFALLVYPLSLKFPQETCSSVSYCLDHFKQPQQMWSCWIHLGIKLWFILHLMWKIVLALLSRSQRLSAGQLSPSLCDRYHWTLKPMFILIFCHIVDILTAIHGSKKNTQADNRMAPETEQTAVGFRVDFRPVRLLLIMYVGREGRTPTHSHKEKKLFCISANTLNHPIISK